VKPTPRAEDLRPVIRQALLTLENAIVPGNVAVLETQGIVRMVMADSTASLLLPSLVREMKQVAPRILLQTLPPTTRDPRPSILHGDIDIAVGLYPGIVEQLQADQGTESPLRSNRLYIGEYVCIMRKGHPLASAELTMDDYCAASHVLVSFSGRAYGLADQVLSAMERKRNIMLTVNQYFTAAKIVEGTDLISLMPRHSIASINMDGVLIAKQLPFKLPLVHVDMLWHERDVSNISHQWLRNTLHAMADADSNLRKKAD
jgi:DNA-binding transcriptional LysR family regulator